MQNNAGSDTLFQDLGMALKPTCTDAVHVNSFVLVQVYDSNAIRDTLIGRSEVDIAPLFWDKTKLISCDILGKSNKKTGHVTIELKLQSKIYISRMDSKILTIPKIKLCFTRFECSHLKNMRGLVTSSNDVYFEAFWDNIASFKSDILVNAGSSAVFLPFDAGDMVLLPQPDTQPKSGTIRVKVSDSSRLSGRKLIGEIYFNLSPLVLDVEKECKTSIFSETGEKTGDVLFKIILTTKDIHILHREQRKIDQGSFFHNIMSKESLDNLRKTHQNPNKPNHEYNWSLLNPAIKRSINFEIENFKIVLMDIAIVLIFIFHTWTIWLCYFLNWHNRSTLFKIFFHSSWIASNVFGMHYILLILMIGTIHRALGYIGGLVIRAVMNSTMKYTGSWDIHTAWFNININRDELQVELHNVVWRNPPEFHQTPVCICIYLLCFFYSQCISYAL